MTAPLLEEERDAGVDAAVAQVAHPRRITGRCSAPDSPPAISQSMPSGRGVKRTEQRLGANEPHGGGRRTQVVGTPGVASVLDRRAQPHVRQRPRADRCRSSSGEARHALRTLREHLERVLGAAAMTSKTSRDELVGHVLVEQVGHGVDEDDAAAGASAGAGRGVSGCNGEAEARAGLCAGVTVELVARLAHRLSRAGQGERVAVVAAGRDAIAAGHRVPRGFGPFDSAGIGHMPHFRWFGITMLAIQSDDAAERLPPPSTIPLWVLSSGASPPVTPSTLARRTLRASMRFLRLPRHSRPPLGATGNARPTRPDGHDPGLDVMEMITLQQAFDNGEFDEVEIEGGVEYRVPNTERGGGIAKSIERLADFDLLAASGIVTAYS